MFKSLTTRIFLSFALLILFSLAALTYEFSRISIQERESHLLELLSRRSEVAALEINEMLKTLNPSELSQNKKLSFILSSGEIVGPENSRFANFELENLPPTGTIVSPCNTLEDRSAFCSISRLPAKDIWLLSSIERQNFMNVSAEVLRDLISSTVFLFLLALMLAFALSGFIAGPIRRLTQSAERIGKGEYQNLELDSNGNDEIGRLSTAFVKMINEIRERERNIALTGEKLAHSARLASMGQMGASIAHEVKNPLMSMKGYAKIIFDKEQSEELKDAAKVIQEEAERCNSILQQMLRFSRKESSQDSAYEIKEVIDSTVLLSKSEAKSRQVKIDNNSKSSAVVRGNPRQIQQVLLNLIINALHASKEAQTVSINTNESDSSIEIEVRDQGQGIPENLRNQIFEPFFTTKKEGEGSGLGLSIAREIVENQGGKLRFESETGKGTSFFINLNLA
jgi:signal transduction histidine kinase